LGAGEEVHPIYAGKDPVYEVVKSEDGLRITIRAADNHDEKVELMSSVVPILVQVLQDLKL
jgi:hypothetical protein